ncbi:MAG: TIM barrel protein [Patulibacter minatonensis]
MAVSTTSVERLSLLHHPVGVSTGWLSAEERRSGQPSPSWAALTGRARRKGDGACELAALSEHELPSLVEWLETSPSLPFDFLSVHAPSKHRRMPEADLVDLLVRVVGAVDAITLHPDVIEDHAHWARLGATLAIENMDPRKGDGQTAESLARHFELLPEAGLCFDVAHAYAIDPSLGEGHLILDHFGHRLRHLHVSALDVRHHHVALGPAEERRIAPFLERCRDVPWLLEAPLA